MRGSYRRAVSGSKVGVVLFMLAVWAWCVGIPAGAWAADATPPLQPSVTAAVTTPTATPPGKPKLVGPYGGCVGRYVKLTVTAGSSTTTLTLQLNLTNVATYSVTPGKKVYLGRFAMRPGMNKLRIMSWNADGVKGSWLTTARRVDQPWATCLVVDKSDFRVYWFKDSELVKWYPCAHGKPSTPTPERVWKVGSKEYTSGVSGPRKLRLFKRISGRHGYSYQYSAYGIHGTNEPWVIGTMASHGCIRLYNKDILDLFPRVPLGTLVQTRY